jgi:hypothetical protein
MAILAQHAKFYECCCRKIVDFSMILSNVCGVKTKGFGNIQIKSN